MIVPYKVYKFFTWLSFYDSFIFAILVPCGYENFIFLILLGDLNEVVKVLLFIYLLIDFLFVTIWICYHLQLRSHYLNVTMV